MGSDQPLKITILTGEKQEGKTTWLKENIRHFSGFLSPVENQKRHFLLLPEGHWIPMENPNGGLKIGKYSFEQHAFAQAESHLRSKTQDPVLVLDEIGPLELQEKGFSTLLKDLITSYRGQLILVVRKGMVEKTITYFKLGEHELEIIEIEKLKKGETSINSFLPPQ